MTPVASTEPAPTPQVSTIEPGWQQLSMWAALPTALQLLRPRVLLTALPGLVATVVVLREVLGDSSWNVALVLMVAAAVALGAWVGWALAWRHRFRFHIDEQGITVRSGVAYRSEVGLGWERVRNVDVRQAFYFRPLDRVTLVLEGTGGSDEVVMIPAVTRDFAEIVRGQVVARRAVDPATRPAGVDGEAGEDVEVPAASGVLHEPHPWELLMHGALNGRAFALLLAGIGVLFSALSPWIEETELLTGAIEWFSDRGLDGVAWLLVALPALVLVSALLVVISAVAALVLYWRFTLTADGERYVFRQGLVETQERSLRASKLQALTTVETAVGRLFGRCHLLVHKASSTSDSDDEQDDGTIVVPALSRGAAESLVRRLDAAAAPRPHLHPIDPAYRRFWLQRLLASVVAGLLAALIGVIATLESLASVVILLVALAAVIAVVTTVLVTLAARNWGWALEGTVLFIRSGVLGRNHAVFYLDRVQHLAVTRSPYQRRHGLATVALVLADGERSIPFLADRDAVELANRTLYEVETAAHLDL